MKIAIDVVLLPSPAMAKKALQINQELLKNDDNKIVFSESCLPHISLCMGAVEEDDLPAVQRVLGVLSAEFLPFELVAERLRADVIPTGQKVSGLRVRDDGRLGEFQSKIMARLWPYLSYSDLDAGMFYGPDEIEDVTFMWVKNYAKKRHDQSLFHPHITVGFGETGVFDAEFPISFTTPTLALCQLGNYCTARKVYARFVGA